jgi:hypothetical protein
MLIMASWCPRRRVRPLTKLPRYVAHKDPSRLIKTHYGRLEYLDGQEVSPGRSVNMTAALIARRRGDAPPIIFDQRGWFAMSPLSRGRIPGDAPDPHKRMEHTPGTDKGGLDDSLAREPNAIAHKISQVLSNDNAHR